MLQVATQVVDRHLLECDPAKLVYSTPRNLAAKSGKHGSDPSFPHRLYDSVIASYQAGTSVNTYHTTTTGQAHTEKRILF